MGDVRVTINVNELKANIRDVIDRKIGAVTSDTIVYDRVMGAIWEGMQMSGELPVDSGALETGEGGPFTSKHTSWTDKKGRVHQSTLYPRYGNTTVTTHGRQSTLHVNPVEVRPSYDVYYASRQADKIEAAKDSAMEDAYVLSQIAEIVGDKMRES